MEELNNVDGDASKKKTTLISIESASEDELRAFLLELASKNKRLRKKFEKWVCDSCPQSEIDKWSGTLSGSIDEVFSTSEEAFLYGSDSLYYENECDNAYDDAIYSFQGDLDTAFKYFTDRGYYDELFLILCDMYAYADSVNRNGRWEVADSGDEAEVQVQKPILETIQKLLTLPISSELHDKIYVWVRGVLKEIAKEEFSGYGNDETIWKLFFSNLQTPEEQSSTLQMVNELLELDETTLLLEKKFQLMDALTYPLEEIETAETPYLENKCVYTRRIERAAEAGKYDEAAAILAEHLKQESPDMHDIERYRQLAGFYEQANDLESCKMLRKDILISPRAEVDDYLAYRKLFSADEWGKLREDVLAIVPDRYMNQVLNAEEMYDRLLMRLKERGDIHELQKYERQLAKLYPNELLQIRLTTACEMMNHVPSGSSARRYYCEVLRIFEGSLRYDSGVAQVTEILTTWLDIHKRRRALWDELQKLPGLRRIWSSITEK
ncbi:MAG TPA: hypothetical protein O0X50_00240 [Methanocorpusculum sp.]|nr:hypothetical protein [Methanocorpusculum sp.]